jgi:general stress protein YciG
MTELKVAGLVDIPDYDKYNVEKRIVLNPKFDWFLSDEFERLSGKCLKKSPPHRDNNNGKEGGEQSKSNQDTIQEEVKDSALRGGEISKQSIPPPPQPPPLAAEEPNGGNYERKGLANIFRCLDCGLNSFQAEIENHKCPAWSEKKNHTKLDSGEWLLDK